METDGKWLGRKGGRNIFLGYRAFCQRVSSQRACVLRNSLPPSGVYFKVDWENTKSPTLDRQVTWWGIKHFLASCTCTKRLFKAVSGEAKVRPRTLPLGFNKNRHTPRLHFERRWLALQNGVRRIVAHGEWDTRYRKMVCDRTRRGTSSPAIASGFFLEWQQKSHIASTYVVGGDEPNPTPYNDLQEKYLPSSRFLLFLRC